jgi:hypothetical protein
VSVEYSDRGLRRSMRFTPGGGATADSEGWCKLSGGCGVCECGEGG